MTLQLEQSLDREHSEKNFQRDIDAITSRQLSPENIDSYAEDALEDLVTVVEHAVASYDDNPTQDFETNKQREIAALRYFGLDADTVEQQLDHIADVADEIRDLDKVIDEITHSSNDVIVPPNPDGARIIPGEGRFEKKQVMPRLKTLLFVLSNNFGLDLHDEEQVRVTTGILKDTMMRGESYNFVDIPALNRVVLVCDEEGNATYVFDRDMVLERLLSADTLSAATKGEINTMVGVEPEVGKRIVYTTQYVQNMVHALSSLSTKIHLDHPSPEGQYLKSAEAPPEGYLSKYALRKVLDTSHRRIDAAISELGEQLGETNIYRFKTHSIIGYSPDQQEMIKGAVEKRALRYADEDTWSFTTMYREFGIGPDTLSDAIEATKSQLGDIELYRFGKNPKPGYGYRADQRKIIADYLELNFRLVSRPPEGVVSQSGLMQMFRVQWDAIKKALDAIGGELGETKKYRFHTQVSDGYDLVQQDMVRKYLESIGAYGEKKPEDFLTINGIARSLGLNLYTVEEVVATLTEAGTLGEPARYVVWGKRALCYGPDQVKKIKDCLAERGSLAEAAPEGYSSIGGFAKAHNINYARVKQAVDEQDDSFGEIAKFRFRGHFTDGLSPHQQKVLLQYFGRANNT